MKTSIPVTKNHNGTQLENMWTRGYIGEILPGVVTPMTWAIFRAAFHDNPDLALSPQNGEMEDVTDVGCIRGRAYMNLNALLDNFCSLPTITPDMIAQLIGINLPEIVEVYSPPNSRTNFITKYKFLGQMLGVINQLDSQAEKFASPPVADRSQFNELLAWNTRCLQLYLKIISYSIGAFGLLNYYFQRWNSEITEHYLLRIITTQQKLEIIEQTASLWNLTAFIKENAELKAILANLNDWSQTQSLLNNLEGGMQFLISFKRFIEENGHRTAGELELSVPRWSENPIFLLQLLNHYLEHPNESAFLNPFESTDKLERITSILSPQQRFIVSRLINSLNRFTILHETTRSNLVNGWTTLRKCILEIGADLVIKKYIRRVEDIFFLTPYEAFETEKKENPEINIHRLIHERREYHSVWESLHAPALVDSNGREIPLPTGDTIKGIGCSPGIVEGHARVLYEPKEIQHLKSNEILITPHTNPGWFPVFLSCRAIVTELGGMLSYGAIVAREFGIPAVFNVEKLTQKIQTGDYIRVNGSTGLIEIVKN